MTDVDPKPQQGGEGGQKPQNPADDTLEKFTKIKERYEEELSAKDKEIEDLKAQLSKKDKEVNDTINSLNNEVNDKLAQAEELNKLRENVQELLTDKANALVDKYINEGKLVPAQREKALNLCLADQDMFIELYENAPSVIDTSQKPRSTKVKGNVEKMAEYFKN